MSWQSFFFVFDIQTFFALKTEFKSNIKTVSNLLMKIINPLSILAAMYLRIIKINCKDSKYSTSHSLYISPIFTNYIPEDQSH